MSTILSINDFCKIRPYLNKVVCTSGGFDPIHPGHLSCLAESKFFGDTLVVLVNGDQFLTNKKGKPFQDISTRCQIVSYVVGVDFVIPFDSSDPNDPTVCEALRLIKPNVFTKGGDRISPETIPEWKICQEFGIDVKMGIGKPKLWSSSDLLAQWKK